MDRQTELGRRAVAARARPSTIDLREGKKHRGQAIEIGQRNGGNPIRITVLRPDGFALGAPTHNAGPMGAGFPFIGARPNVIRGRRPLRVAPRDFAVEPGQRRRRKLRLARGQFAADPQQVRLDGFEEGGFRGTGDCRAEEAKGGVQFVQGPQCADQNIRFLDAQAAGQGGEASVAHVLENRRNRRLGASLEDLRSDFFRRGVLGWRRQ